LTSCTPPKWVPELTAALAVEHYGVRLRKALAELVSSSEFVRNRVDSMDSDNLSVDSGDDDFFQIQEPKVTYKSII
jgi:hypothetical protein